MFTDGLTSIHYWGLSYHYLCFFRGYVYIYSVYVAFLDKKQRYLAFTCITDNDSQCELKDVQVYPASLAVCSDTVLHTAGESTE